MIWAALYSTITFGLSVVVFICYLVTLLKIRKNRRHLKVEIDTINEKQRRLAESYNQLLLLKNKMDSKISVDAKGRIVWHEK